MMLTFTKWILIVDFILVSIATGLYFLLSDSIHFYAMLTSIGITTLNALIGFFLIDKFFHASMNQFMSIVFGSMFFRLMALGGFIIVILLFSNFPQITFIVSLFISYICKSVLEIIFINKKSIQKN
jgi:hypothetical protein